MTCQLDICGNATALLTVSAVAVGWFAVHWLNSRRDRKNAERLIRLNELAKAHHVLIRSVIDGALTRPSADSEPAWKNREAEDSIATIYLYGTLEQAALANAYVKELELKGTGSLDDLVGSIRHDLRKSLGLKKLKGPLSYLRLNVK